MIRIGICGYGNLGKGVEKAIELNEDMNLVAIFSRRDIKHRLPVIKIEEIEKFKEKIDVVIMCGGSKNDLQNQVPLFAKIYNTVDSFDNHNEIYEYYKKIDKINRENKTVSLISAGWDPGLFSMARLYSKCILPKGKTYTFWGKGVSQGHSNALKEIDGIKDAIEYTIPKEESIKEIEKGETIDLTDSEKHLRECYIVLEDGADKKRIENQIINMKNYFEGYGVIFKYITEEELNEKHNKMPHGGKVISLGETSDENTQRIEYSLKLDSNPEFTASVLVSYARAVYKLSVLGDYGTKTVFDIPLNLMSIENNEKIIKEYL